MSWESMMASARTWASAARSSGSGPAGLELEALAAGAGVRVPGEPAGDIPDGGRGRRQRRLSRAALAGALVQVGLERVELAGSRPSGCSPRTSAWCRRARSAYVPEGFGCAGMCRVRGRLGLICGSRRGAWFCQAARCAATYRSAALARFCHRWNRSATWAASQWPCL